MCRQSQRLVRVDRTDRVVNDASASPGIAENDPAIACLLPVVAAWSYGIAALGASYCIRGYAPSPLYSTILSSDSGSLSDLKSQVPVWETPPRSIWKSSR